jgi:large subunit ribosomal protein L31
MAKTKTKIEEKAKGKTVPYHEVIVTCACGAQFDSGSTLKSIHVDICSQCHPFFTGEDRIVDIEGRVEKFRKKYQKDTKKDKPKK